MNKKILLTITLALSALGVINAQQRKCEMNITLLSPSEGTIVPAYAQYSLIVQILNNGPNDLLQGDTVYYNIPTMPLISYSAFVLPQAILSGTSANITLATLVNMNQNTADETTNFYATVVSNLDTSAGAFVDQVLTNNTDANQITFKPCGPNNTGINNVNASDLNIDIFPNPVNDYFTVRSSKEPMQSIKVMDISGRVVATQALNDTKEGIIQLDAIPAGMYFLKIETAAGIASAKIIKQ